MDSVVIAFLCIKQLSEHFSLLMSMYVMVMQHACYSAYLKKYNSIIITFI